MTGARAPMQPVQPPVSPGVFRRLSGMAHVLGIPSIHVQQAESWTPGGGASRFL
jgi:hypothetical protein